jgi:hypothetical protein
MFFGGEGGNAPFLTFIEVDRLIASQKKSSPEIQDCGLGA